MKQSKTDVVSVKNQGLHSGKKDTTVSSSSGTKTSETIVTVKNTSKKKETTLFIEKDHVPSDLISKSVSTEENKINIQEGNLLKNAQRTKDAQTVDYIKTATTGVFSSLKSELEKRAFVKGRQNAKNKLSF